jgi:alkylation response protein AidB-like acyl-CoA dehydrogenase
MSGVNAISRKPWAFTNHRCTVRSSRDHSRSAPEVLRLRVASVRGALGTWQTPVGMIFRDLRAFRPYDGPTEVHKYAIAREV